MGCCEGPSKPFDLTKRIDVSKKRLINNKAVDVNQLCPIKYKWAWEHYINGCANHWMPTEVSMQKDIEQWKDPKVFSADERRVIMRNLGFFSTGESLVGNNIVLAIFKHVTNPEARQYLLRQAFEEALHTHTFQYCCESLNLDQREVFNMYHEVDAIAGKDQFVMNLTADIMNDGFKTDSIENIQKFIKNLVGFYVIMEGIFFYSGFAMILSFHRRNQMVGIGEQFQYIMRDETIHMNFGVDLIKGICDENPGVWTKQLQDEIVAMVKEAVKYEIAYAADCLPNGVLGLNASMFDGYVKYIANRRLERLDIAPVFSEAKNPFAWMSETIDLKKEKNFFETRVTEYAGAGSLEW
jgi:ribonucleoside-diphosphate reductase beta chain